MRRFNYLLLFLSALLLIKGCGKPYTVGQLFINNNTGEILYLESYIVSHLSEEPILHNLQPGESCELARTKKHSGYIDEFDISEFVNNTDATIKIYSLNQYGDKTIVAQWEYTDRSNNSKSIFNLSELDYSNYYDPDGGYHPTYTFVLLPEDLE